MSRRHDDELDGLFDPEFAVAIPEALREDFEKWLDRYGLVMLPRAEQGTYYTTEADASARRMAELAKREEPGGRSKPRHGKRR